MLENEIGLPIRRDARIDQLSNMGMGKTTEEAPLALEALAATAAQQHQARELDGHLALVTPIAAPGQPHRSHSTLPDGRQKGVGTDRLALEGRLDRHCFR